MRQSNRPFRAVVVHDRAGRLEPVRLAIRYDVSDASEADTLHERPLVPGGHRVGPFALRVAADAAGDHAVFDATAENTSQAPVRLDAVIFGFRWRGVDTAALRFLRHGWQSWSFTGARALDDAGESAFPSGSWLRGMHHALGSPPSDRDGWHESDLVSVAGVTPSGPACAAGVLERGRGFGIVYLRREGDAVRVELEVRVEARFAPGERREIERVHLALGDDPIALLERFADALGREAGARAPRPLPAGWCTWYHFFSRVTEDDLRRNLDALVARRDELPVDVVQLDDGYQRAVGDWLETNEKFPSGLEKLAAEIRDAGFTPGLWTAPWLVAPESRLFEAHPDWLLRDGGQLFRGLHHPVWSREGWIHVLDTSRDDVLRHLRELFARLVGMGFSYQKLDFLYAVAMGARSRDPGVARATRLRRGLEAVRAGAGEDALLLGCGCPLGAAVGVVDAMRIGPDVAPRWDVDPETAIPGIEPTLPATRNAVRNVLARAWMHRRLWINDPDCLMARSTGTELSRDEARTLAGVSAATGGLVVFSDDVSELSAADATLVRETVALAREVDEASGTRSARALDVLGDEFAAGAIGRTPSGALLALVNPDDAARTRSLDLARLQPTALRPVGEPLLGTLPRCPGARSELRVELAPHASAVWRLRLARIAVFCDYDGTFAQQDIGSTFAQRYAKDPR
jgi:alpha-galactosidase